MVMQRRGGKSAGRKAAYLSKAWLITGTSSGFGRALTEQLLARGDQVAAALRWVDAVFGTSEGAATMQSWPRLLISR
jgi:NADP-dependent 3-hydroxy acid dehydrogenase YdfG